MAKSYLESLLGLQEKIILIARQHWLILVSSIFLEVAVILIVFVASITAAILIPPYALIIAAIGFIVMLLPIATMIRDILDWTNRQYVVTNRRVIQISGIFNKNVVDSSLEKVNDLRMSQSAMGRIFDYGDVEIMTASELQMNRFKQIEDPVSFQTVLLNAKEKMERGETPLAPSEGFAGIIEQLDRLRQQGILSEEEFQQKKAELLAKL
jgi:uncharacterized membrane protein YdbT with pleckstrin-like domain